jgi:hypothetical protein
MTPLNTNRHYGPGTHIQQNYVIGILYNVYIPIQYLYCKQKNNLEIWTSFSILTTFEAIISACAKRF